MDLNRATIIGNVTRDPEVRTIASGQSVCSFGVATNMQWRDSSGQKQQRAEFHNLVAWGKLAEICGQYLGKGRKVYVEGRLQTREWEGQDGQKRNRTEIVADNMILLDRPGSGPVGGPSVPGSNTDMSSTSSDASSSSEVDPGVGDQEIRLEDIPF
ncbi:single-stranded DNA-binding protein [Candidatus Uhrbacteria bacterium CG22_combo_CG10-13_8_21_14_all_47_17]|uniref:Single-stranded DNA-binding protein n=1 Tax=Candidatus Uhrbacteria bacterium CG22_combo_CG10-13_8_21_14_all_47_17 TaxID=1975041 RepID=A0A2H0BSQ3_9BACT|nr:MAG: single-stranded DNA-binding protein [Candidatus Uhrbacteria bacterium CG22_combo_CG10-13_8_21_14_all_47_17]